MRSKRQKINTNIDEFKITDKNTTAIRERSNSFFK